MRLRDEDGNEYDVEESAAIPIVKRTREDDARNLIVEVISEALQAQRVSVTVLPHANAINLGTDAEPRIEQFTCKAAIETRATIVEPVNELALANTIITRFRAHGFWREESSEQASPAEAAS